MNIYTTICIFIILNNFGIMENSENIGLVSRHNKEQRFKLSSSDSLPLKSTYGSVPLFTTDFRNIPQTTESPHSKDDIELKPLYHPMRPTVSIDQFGDITLTHKNDATIMNTKVTRTGRQRKKLAARTKGGEFETKKKKRRVNFCCICSEIDLEGLYDKLFDLQLKGGDQSGLIWETKMYQDVLHIFQTKKANLTEKKATNVNTTSIKDHNVRDAISNNSDKTIKLLRPTSLKQKNSIDASSPLIDKFSATDLVFFDDSSVPNTNSFHGANNIGYESARYLRDTDQPGSSLDKVVSSNRPTYLENTSGRLSDDHKHDLLDMSLELNEVQDKQSTEVLWSTGGREAFIFEFGAVVFWGFPKGEEDELIELVREYIEQGEIDANEFDEGCDDMAFVTTSSDYSDITIANDVIALPDKSTAKSRMSVSFAIAQSAVLNIFEARVESKIKEYKHIPETLSSNQDLQLTTKKLGTMIGEVYRIRHDVNLHSEILDTPDFFWKEEECEKIYQMTCKYLELYARTDILNKRVDMLRELLIVLQHRQDNSSAVKLEWIVIWLIVVSATVEGLNILVNYFLNKDERRR